MNKKKLQLKWKLKVEYSLSMAGIKVAVERIVSTINVLWTDETNRFVVKTIKQYYLCE